MPPDPRNLLVAWQACRTAQFTVWDEDAPLEASKTAALADTIVARRALTTAVDDTGVGVDLALSMSGLAFAEVDAAKRDFLVDGVTVPVARLSHILQSQANAGRVENRLFLTLHREVLATQMRRHGSP